MAVGEAGVRLWRADRERVLGQGQGHDKSMNENQGPRP
jgi:hypothetical protein